VNCPACHTTHELVFGQHPYFQYTMAHESSQSKLEPSAATIGAQLLHSAGLLLVSHPRNLSPLAVVDSVSVLWTSEALALQWYGFALSSVRDYNNTQVPIFRQSIG
jgi:hypothetical protein